jgi:hypothetical protein
MGTEAPEELTSDHHVDAPDGKGSDTSGAVRWFRRRWAQNLGAFVLYAGASVLLFGRGAVGDVSHRVVGGVSSDADAFLWFMAWWPHAIAHGSYPFFTHAVWAPTGISLMWTTAVPVPSLALWPITTALGPVAGFDALQLLVPATGAWATYLLCRRVSGDALASFAGGWLFGFSSYTAIQLLAGHPNLGLTFLVPLAAYLIVRRIEGSLGPVAFVVLLGVTLAAQVGISTEVLATMTLIGAAAGVVGVVVATRHARRAILRTGALAVAAYALAAVLASPALYAAAHFPRPTKATVVGSQAPVALARLAEFVGPGTAAQLRPGFLPDVSGANGAYLGIALVVILVLAAVAGRHRRVGIVLFVVASLAAVTSLGPSVLVGHVHLSTPWGLFGSLPLVRLAAPGRIVMYAVLAAAVAAAIVAADGLRTWQRAVRWSLVGLAILSTLPNVTGQAWSAREPDPPFFATAAYRAFVHPNETVVIVWVRKGDQMYWQARSGMAFGLAGGYLGVTPPGIADATFAKRLAAGQVGPAQTARLRAFILDHHVAAVLVVGASPRTMRAISKAFAVTPTVVGGVTVYRLAA